MDWFCLNNNLRNFYSFDVYIKKSVNRAYANYGCICNQLDMFHLCYNKDWPLQWYETKITRNYKRYLKNLKSSHLHPFVYADWKTNIKDNTFNFNVFCINILEKMFPNSIVNNKRAIPSLFFMAKNVCQSLFWTNENLF